MHKDEPRDKVVRIRSSLFKEMSESELARSGQRGRARRRRREEKYTALDRAIIASNMCFFLLRLLSKLLLLLLLLLLLSPYTFLGNHLRENVHDAV